MTRIGLVARCNKSECRRCGGVKQILARWLCVACYSLLQRTGGLDRYPPMLRGSDPLTRFLAKTDRSGDCWLWTGHVTRKGYGMFHHEGRDMPAHRWAWLYFVGDLAEDVEVHHRCRERRCVRPSHLEALDARDHRLMHCAEGGSANRGVRKSRCPNGHPYDSDESIPESWGRQRCGICRAARLARQRERRATGRRTP